MLLIEQINDYLDKMWKDFAKGKETIEPVKSKDSEVLYPKHTFYIGFPRTTMEYNTKIRSRNIKMALTRLLYKYPKINYKGKIYTPENYPDLQLQLELSGDFDFKKI